MAGCILFCFAVGYFLGKWLGFEGVFITVFILLGIIGGGITVYRQILEVTDISVKDELTDKPDNGSN